MMNFFKLSRPTSLACLVLLLFSVTAANASSKQKLKLADDGFPTDQTTPEGAATDFVRALVQADVELVRRVCLRPYGNGQERSDYAESVSNLAGRLQNQKEKQAQSGDVTGRISKVYAARALSSRGAASYAHATYDFQDVKFVDVDLLVGGGRHHLQRTLVIKDRDGKWYVHPAPNLSPLLSDGLTDESPSERLFSEVYPVGN